MSCVTLDLLLQQLQGVIDSGLTGKILETSLHDLIDRVQRRQRSLAQISRPSCKAFMQAIEKSMQRMRTRGKKPVLLTGKRRGQRPGGLHGVLKLAVKWVIGLPNGKNGVDPVQNSCRV